MNFDYDWRPKLDELQIEFCVIDIDDDGEILRRTGVLNGWVKHYGFPYQQRLVGASIPDDMDDFDTYNVLSNNYTSIREPKYYRTIISGDVILWDGITLLFKLKNDDIGYGMVNLNRSLPDTTTGTITEILQIVKTIDFTRSYTHNEVLHEIERYMML